MKDKIIKNKFDIKKWKIKPISGLTTVVEFNHGYSHIAVDDNCWIILNGGKKSSWIFPEAAKLLKQLPSKPNEYTPYRRYLNMLD